MPNWCFNQVTVKGDKETLALLKKKAQRITKNWKSAFSLDRLVPMPKVLKGTTAPADKPNWYDWALENWGTKWDVEMTIGNETETEILFSGDSAWSPFNAALKTISSHFPTLTFTNEYEEPGMCFRGVYVVKSGIVERDVESEY